MNFDFTDSGKIKHRDNSFSGLVYSAGNKCSDIQNKTSQAQTQFNKFQQRKSDRKDSQTLKSVSPHISKHLEVRQKYSATRRILSSLLGAKKCVQTRSLVYNTLHNYTPANNSCCNLCNS